MELTRPVAMPWRQRLMAKPETPLSVFDFMVVAIALISTSGPLAVLRVLRLITWVPSMKSDGLETRRRYRILSRMWAARVAVQLSLEKGWSGRVRYASENQERHEFQLSGLPVVLRSTDLAGKVRVAIAKRAAPSSHAVHRSSVPRCSP